MANMSRGQALLRLAGAGRSRRAVLGVGGALVGVLVAVFAFGGTRAAPYAATAQLAQPAVYLNDSGALVSIVVSNTGTSTSIGAVQIRRPDNNWSVTSCEAGPAGWSVQRADPLCRYRSAEGTADDIPVGGTATFSLRVATDPGTADRVGAFGVVVSSSNQFDNPSLLTAAAEGASSLDLVAHSFQVLDAVVAEAPASPGAACPLQSREALVDSTTVIVVCGRNRTSIPLAPSADDSSLGGTFLHSPGTFSSGVVLPTSSSVVLGNWTDARVRSTGGTDLTVVAVIAASTIQTSPSTVLTGYTAINDPPVAGDDGPYTALEDGSLSIAAPGVLANDSDADGHPISISLAQDAAHGSVTLNADGSFSYQGAAEFFGDDSFTYTADDGHGGTDTASVAIDVTPVNDAPTFDLPADAHASNEDAGAQSVAGFAAAITAGADNEAGQSLSFMVSSDNPGLFAAPPTISPSGTLTYQARSDAFGSALVSATLHDDGGTANGGVDESATQQFTITVNSVNDAPSFSLPANPDQVVGEDAGAQTISSFASSISAGPANEAAQSVHFDVSNDNAALFAVEPAIADDGTLTYRPADDGSGSATVTVIAQDDGGTANGGVDTSTPQTFTISVNEVNDPPAATDHSFGTAVGNTLFAVGRPTTLGPAVHVTGNLLDGASDPDGPPPLEVVAGTVTSGGRGTVTLFADGTFTYLPARGYGATSDSFSYQVVDGAGATSPSAAVQIALSGDVVWYVDNAAAAGGDGRSNAPYSSLAALNAASDPDDQGDVIFVYGSSTAYGGGFAMEADQQLVGEPAGLTVAGNTIVPAGGTRPSLAGASGNGLTLASGASIAAIEVSGAAGDGIAGTNVSGTVTLSDVLVTGSDADNARLSASSGSLTLVVSNSTFRSNDTSTGGHGLRLTAGGTSTVTATIDGSTFADNRIAGVQAVTEGGGTLDVVISDGVFDSRFNGIDVVHASTGNLTATVARNTISTAAPDAGAPINLFLSSQAGSSAGSIFRATVDDNDVSNNGSLSAPGIWYHTGASAGHARLLIRGNDVSAIGQRGISVEAGTGSSTVDAMIADNDVSLPADGLEGIFVQAGVVPGDTVGVCADITTNEASSAVSDIRVRQRFSATTLRLPGYGGSGTDDAAVRTFLAGQNTVADVLASHESAAGFGGGASCAQP